MFDRCSYRVNYDYSYKVISVDSMSAVPIERTLDMFRFRGYYESSA